MTTNTQYVEGFGLYVVNEVTRCSESVCQSSSTYTFSVLATICILQE